MKVLMISGDSSILKEGSAARARMIAYAALVEELSVLVCVRGAKTAAVSHQLNLTLYPIKGMRFAQVWSLCRLGRRIIAQWGDMDDVLVTAQDPFELGCAGYCITQAARAKRVRLGSAGRIMLQLQVHTELLSPYFARGSAINALRTMIARFLLPHADGIRVVSERIKHALVTRWNISEGTITVLPIYTDRAHYAAQQRVQEAGLPSWQYRILAFARIEREKNTLLAVETLKLVRDSGIDAGLIVLGPLRKGEERMLKEKIAATALGDRVVLAGRVSDAGFYLRSADALLVTSNFEGYGLTFVEAALAECPVVTTDVGIVGELLTHENAMICPVGDAGCLSAKLIDILTYPNLRTQKTTLLRTAVERKMYTKESYLVRYRQSWEACFHDYNK